MSDTRVPTVKALGRPRLGRRSCRALAVVAGTLLTALVAQPAAWAAPRDDAKDAYAKAISQFNDMDFEGAQVSLELAIEQAKNSGLATDPALAPLLALYGGVIHTNTGDRTRALEAFKQAVTADYHVRLPIELRSEELQGILDEARSAAGSAPSTPVVHSPPALVPGQDLEFEAVLGVPVEGGQVALYWRRAGEADFRSVSMDLFGNLATATVSASEHGDATVEYFIYAFDSDNQPVAGTGDQENPLVVEGSGGSVASGPADGGDKDDKDDEDEDDKEKPATRMPRVFINIGLGTGFGVAPSGATVERTYQQIIPGDASYLYGPAQEACAFARWASGTNDLPRDAFAFDALYGQAASEIERLGGTPTFADRTTLAMAYNPDECGTRHPVAGGMASAPFHIEPEIAFSMGKRRRFVLGIYGRLQVVTGSSVFRDDPNKQYADSYVQDVRNNAPPGVADAVPFTWAVGVKAKYFFLPDENKFRLFAGGFAGGGAARLRIDMGFSDDRNGNSVPDDLEGSGWDASGTDDCYPVWPYTNACLPPQNDPDGAGAADRANAESVSANAGGNRIDTVKIGPGFVGALFGFNYQVHKNFALFGEIQAGGWFPATSSFMFDINLGPAITF